MASKQGKKSLPGGRMWLVAVFFTFALVWGTFGLGLGTKQPCANSISCISDLTGTYQHEVNGTFLGKSIGSPPFLAEAKKTTEVLGETTEKKHIYVNLETQELTAYEGNKEVFRFLVSTGKWGRTPTGVFKIWIKLRYARMEGGSGSDYYNLPNVPHVMFFYNDDIAKSRGFSIHAAYWHNNFGYRMSHGCVNLRPADAEKIYNWADPSTKGNMTYADDENPGTLITIYE